MKRGFTIGIVAVILLTIFVVYFFISIGDNKENSFMKQEDYCVSSGDCILLNQGKDNQKCLNKDNFGEGDYEGLPFCYCLNNKCRLEGTAILVSKEGRKNISAEFPIDNESAIEFGKKAIEDLDGKYKTTSFYNSEYFPFKRVIFMCIEETPYLCGGEVIINDYDMNYGIEFFHK